MLQDLSYGRLENEFRNVDPVAGDFIVCVSKNNLLVHKESGNILRLPVYEQVFRWAENWNSWGEESFRFVFRLHGVNYFLWMGEAGTCPDEAYGYEPARSLRYIESKELCYAAMTAWHLYNWYRNNRFCGCCGTPTVHDEKERMVRCPECGNLIFAAGSAAISCCGILLPALDAEEPDDAHVITIEQVEDEHYVSVSHEMTKQHYISFLAWVTTDQMQLVKLYPEGAAASRFRLRGTGRLYLYCNRHGLMNIDSKKLR